MAGFASPMDLNELHKSQISRQASFFKGKREKIIADRDAEKEDFKNDHNADDARLFNKGEMDQMLDYYHYQVMAKVREELEFTSKLAGVYTALFLGQAEAYGMSLQVEDISIIEDRGRLDQISSIAAVSGAPPAVPRARQALAPMGMEAAADPKVLQELSDVREEKRQMEERYIGMQAEVSGLLRERSTLSSELEKMKLNFGQLMAEMQANYPANVGSASAVEVERLLNDTKGTLDMKSAECESMRQDLNARLGDSSQFRDLKGIVKKKSDEIKNLKAVLQQYGIAPPASADGGVELQADSD